MEKYSKTTRFCLVCNHVSNIIPALISRCTWFKFLKIKDSDAFTRLKEISENERLQVSDLVIWEVYWVGSGDMR